MKVTYLRITILAYFLTDALNWQVLWGKEKYLDTYFYISILYEKVKKKGFSRRNVNTEEYVSSKNKQIN